MKNVLITTALCIVFTKKSTGQGPMGMQRGQDFQNQQWQDPWMGGNPLQALSGGGGGGFEPLPPEIAAILGRTVSGTMDGLPQHGGAGDNANGLREGWGDNPNDAVVPSVANWNDPWNGAAYPADFQGEELIYDAANNRWVRPNQQPSSTQHLTVTNGGLVLGGEAFDHSALQNGRTNSRDATGPGSRPAGGSPAQTGDQQTPDAAPSQTHNNQNKQGIIAAGKPKFLEQGGPVNVAATNSGGQDKQKVGKGIATSLGIIAAGKPSYLNTGKTHEISVVVRNPKGSGSQEGITDPASQGPNPNPIIGRGRGF